MSRSLTNDPTGTYQGWCQGHNRKRLSGRKFRKKSSKKHRFKVAQYETRSGSQPSAPVHISRIPTKPSRPAWEAAKVSNDFWSRVKPRTVPDDACAA